VSDVERELTSLGIKDDVATKAQKMVTHGFIKIKRLKNQNLEEVMESGGFTKGEANTIMAHLKK
jgi:predicted nucleic acid-binding protein